MHLVVILIIFLRILDLIFHLLALFGISCGINSILLSAFGMFFLCITLLQLPRVQYDPPGFENVGYIW